MTTRPTFEVHVDTRLLHQALVAVQPGETITYETLAAAVGRDVEGADSNLQSALRRALRDEGFVFSNIAKVGYQRLTDEQIVTNSPNDLVHIRRKAKRASEKLFKVADLAKLPTQKQSAFNTSASLFGAIAAFLTPRGIKAVEAGVTVKGGELPVAETVRLFMK